MKNARITGWVSGALALLFSGFLIYGAWIGTFHPYVQRAVPLALAVALAFLLTTARRKARGDQPVPWYDWCLAALAIPVFGYAALYPDHLANRFPMTRITPPTVVEIVLGCLAIALLIEASRRTVGWVMVIVVAIVLAYGVFGHHIPWTTMTHSGFDLVDILDHLFLTMEGIWGTALGIAATYIALFVVFGAFMDKGGATSLFIELSNAIAGENRGGPAKVVVFSSALVGSVTGSTVANVYTTGQLTIPMMKRVGYRPAFAGAVEALASNGGQMMPPVLGAAAFILASYAGVPYATVMLASLVPAFIYFGALLWYIHLEAIKTGLEGMPKGSAPSLSSVLLRSGHLILPLILLIVLLARGNSPMPSALYAILLMVAVSWIRPETRMGPRAIRDALIAGARNSVMIVVICATIGIVIGIFTMTGLGLNVSSAIVNLAGGSFVLMLVLIAIAAIVLGTGMNTVAAFVLVSVVAVPALTGAGVDRLNANMFVFYLALLSMITPPVCLAVFAGASIAGSDPWRTAFTAMKLGVVAYLLPFLTIISPGLLMLGTPVEIAVDIATTVAGAFALVVGIQGCFLERLSLPPRVLWILAGCAFLWSTPVSVGVGAVLVALLVGWSVASERRARPALRPPGSPAE